MGKTHLKPLIAVIIQSAKLTESEQTKVCSEAHNLQANWRRLKFVPKRTIPLESAQMWPVIAQQVRDSTVNSNITFTNWF